LKKDTIVKIGTRKSKLAIWQAEFVASLLKKKGIESELLAVETIGDKRLDVTISKIGSKGVFTEEIEEMLKNGEIHIAVHSAKDLQSRLPQPFEILAFTEREIPNDVLISLKKDTYLHAEDSFSIGTASTRRVATLKRYFPKVKAVEVRGNLQTRLQKLKDGHCDALILAFAGVNRMGFGDYIVQHLDPTMFTPPAGQGSIAVEVLKTMNTEVKEVLYDAINHQQTEKCISAERGFLNVMNGGCSIPAFVHANIKDGQIFLTGGILSLDGKKEVRISKRGHISDAIWLGENLAEEVLNSGGQNILNSIRAEL